MDKATRVASRAGLLVAVALFAVSCTESVSPERSRPVPSFSYSPSGVTFNKSNGTMGMSGRLLIKGFNPTNPHHGDAIVATFFWLGSTFIIDSVVDVLTTSPYTPVGNKYTLVEYITAGGYSMATYVATNVQIFPDPNTDPGQRDILAVAAYLSQPVSDGGLTLSTWTGVEDNITLALGNHNSKSGSGSSPSFAHADPIAVNAGALAYTVTMSGLWGLERPPGYGSTGQSATDASIKQDAAFAVQAGAGTIDPQWQWFYGSADTWLVTTLALNTAQSPVGNLSATTSTSGASLDPDGYTVTVDGTGPTQAIAINGSVTFTGLAAGSHSVALSGVAANCTVSGANPQTVTVPTGGTATAAFAVSCAATTGDLTVTTSTSGANLDPDGYTATLDGGASQAIAINDRVTFTSLTPGTHSVALSGVAANCTVSGSNPQTVTVSAGGTATVAFSVTCTPPLGNLTVTTSTSGLSLDLDGYTVAVNGQSRAISINGSVTFTGLPAGNQSVTLSGVAVNCTVTGSNPRDVTVPSGATASTNFTVSCVPGPATRLVFTVQPGNTAPFATITPAVKANVIDAQGNTVTTYTGQVTIGIGRNGGLLLPGTLSGTKTVSPVNGVATFSNLSINQKGNGYTLRVTSSGLTSAESVTFNIALVCLGPLCL
jgi:hypothetical protein